VPEREDLIAELRDLGARLRVPPAVDQKEAVRARLSAPPPRRRRVGLRVAALVAALAASVAAVAPARAAVVEVVGDLLRVAGVEIRREQPGPLPGIPLPGTPLPGAPLPGTPLPGTPSALPSSRVSALDEARRTAGFPIGVPAELGDPEQVLVAERVVTFYYSGSSEPGSSEPGSSEPGSSQPGSSPPGAPQPGAPQSGGAVRFDQFDGRLDTTFFKTSPNAQYVELGGAVTGAAWVPGPHPVTYVGRDGVERTETARLAGPTLIWTTGAVTYRLEGILTLEKAIAVAGSVR
jgi:hypothetical protein